MPDITLKRRAAELRERAHTMREEFKARVLRQAEDKLEDDESKLSGAEIAEKNAEIQALVDEAVATEELDTLDGMMSRPAGDMSQKARMVRELFAEAGVIGEVDLKEKKTFPSVGAFMRSVRGLDGISDGIEFDPLDEAQKRQLVRSWHAAVSFSKGEAFQKELRVDDSSERALQRFQQLAGKALVGDDDTSAGRGDYLVPTEHMAELLSIMGEEQQFINVARQVPMQRRVVDFPRLAQTTVADTRPVFSFAAVTKIGEGVQKPEREPTFEQFTLTAYKYAAYVEASDELLADSIVGVAPVLIQLLTAAIGYEYDRDGMRGSGSSEPQGFVGSACEWVQNRTDANSVSLGDILGLEERFFGGGANARYLHHPSVLPKLGALAASNVIFWNRDVSGRLPGTLLGRPLVRTHKLPTLGTKGDLCLVDPGFYLAGNLQGMTVASSTHFKFRNDLTSWRAVFRGAGSPWPAGLFSMESSGSALTFRVSPFCVLGAVASS